MAKKALLDVLEKTIGKYVQNLDAESLNVAVWSGTIELHSLSLNIEAVNDELARQASEAPNLAVPLRVTGGSFSSLQVDVPWAHLMSQPVVLRAKGLKVEVEPFDRTSTADFLSAVVESEPVRAKRVTEHRLKSIRLADDYRQQANALRKLAEQDLEGSKASSSSSSSFGARLVRRIIENIQVEISDVHIAVKGAQGSAGVVLDSFSLVTTDVDGKRTFVDRSSSQSEFLYKALAIRGLGLYLDESTTFSPRQKLTAIREDPSADEADFFKHSFVLAPLSFDAKLRQADSNVCIDYPKYLLESQVRTLAVLFSKNQMDVAQRLAQQIQPSSSAARPLFPEYRPLARVTASTAREWWRYALRCIGRMNGRRSWPEFYRAFQRRKLYIPLYKRAAYAAQCSWIKPLSKEERAELEGIELDRSISVEGIMTWRNIGDAQVDKEREKHDAKKAAAAKGSLFTSLFGSPSKQTPSRPQDDPPVKLTVEEMKELEAVTMEQVADAELSNDSRLADVKFVLGSLAINLSSYDMRPLATLEMGTVSTSVDANADGSFNFDFSLASLEIDDRVTPKSLFPSILKNQNQTDLDDAMNEAFRLHVAKTKTGDQHLQLRLNTFEAIASPILLLDLKRFLSSGESSTLKGSVQNPLLAQSMSGSVDLFYDAKEGSVPLQIEVGDSQPDVVATDHGNMSDLSHALVEAWKSKTETKAAWVVDLDIHAPILVIPENCVDPRANVLVFDMGRLRLKYGKLEAATRVRDWFHDNPRPGAHAQDIVLDSGSLVISDLTFLVGKTNYWRRLARKQEEGAPGFDEKAVYEPISLKLDFGVESSVKESVPRVCTYGVIPLIGLNVSISHLSRIITVARSWLKVKDQLIPEEKAIDLPAHDQVSKSSSIEKGFSLIEGARRGSLLLSSLKSSADKPAALFFANLSLQRLCVAVETEAGSGMEAHLVSVAASFSSFSDSSSETKLSMGWFWILDRLKSDLPRQQRLVVHSRLPKEAAEFAADGKYDVLGHLESLGVFAEDYVGSKELADITLKQAGASGSVGLFRTARMTEDDDDDALALVDATIDARFSSLYVNWNPRAVKVILGAAGTFGSLVREVADAETGSLILSSPAQLESRFRASDQSIKESESEGMTTLRVRATMNSFHISLNSARDDLPLFQLTMATARCTLVTSSATGDQELSLILDDLRIETPLMGRTDPFYRTIVGLAPGTTESLLSVDFCQGVESIKRLALEDVDASEYEAVARIRVCPVRLVYIQAQILALVEYATEGILGALTAQAASSAAAAAAELAKPTGGKKLFRVTASGLEAILPEAAYRKKFISIKTGSLSVDYTGFPDPGGGRAEIKLGDVVLEDSESHRMQEKPVQMEVGVSLPPDSVGSTEDQAMRVRMQVSQSPFRISKRQYAQFLSTLSNNIGEPDLCVRDSTFLNDAEPAGQEDTTTSELLRGMTHAGVAEVENQRRIYLDIDVKALSLLLCGDDDDDPLVRLDAVEAAVSLQLVTDEGRMSTKVKLNQLECNDKRLKALGRQHVALIYQEQHDGDTQDLFVIEYETRADNSSTLDLQIGSPRFVFIPDAVADLLKFVENDEARKASDTGAIEAAESLRSKQNVVEVESSNDGAVETSFTIREERQLSLMSLSVKTCRCSFILVDLGSSALLPSSMRRFSMSLTSVEESIVFEGIFDARASVKRDLRTGETVSLDAQLHGNEIESYSAFGHDLVLPLQILEPSEASLYLATNASSPLSSIVDVRAAVLKPLDLSLSMRNYALVNAILTSVLECFHDGSGSDDGDALGASGALTEREAAHIEELATVLVSDDPDTSVVSSHSVLSTSVHPGSRDASSIGDTQLKTMSVKLTLPEAKITIINDLQGLDEALLRVTLRSMMAGLQLRDGERIKGAPATYTGFDFSAHTSVLADYFDVPTNRWKPLLTKAWEISLKSARGPSSRFASTRPSTTFDIESFPCYMSFSEQFLMSLASANQMWAVYSTATSTGSHTGASASDKALRRSVAATAARTLITSLPYALENHSGLDLRFRVSGQDDSPCACNSGSTEYFRFHPPKGDGTGGKRMYGQDVCFEKSVTIYFAEAKLKLADLDSQIGFPRRIFELAGYFLVTSVVKEGKTTVLHLSSGVDVFSCVSLPFCVDVVTGERRSEAIRAAKVEHTNSLVMKDGRASRRSKNEGIPVRLLSDFRSSWHDQDSAKLSIIVSPLVEETPGGWSYDGAFDLTIDKAVFRDSKLWSTRFDVTCRPTRIGPSDDPQPGYLDPFVLQVSAVVELIGGRIPAVELAVEPRAIIENAAPVVLSVKTPMPHTYSRSKDAFDKDTSVHSLQPGESMDVFTPGPSIAVSVRCADMPVAGMSSDWMNGWVDLPLVPEFRLPDPLRCEFPFARRATDPLGLAGARGSEFFIAEGAKALAQLSVGQSTSRAAASPIASSGIEVFTGSDDDRDRRSFFITVCNYAIDHTGDLLFEQVESPAKASLRRSATDLSPGRSHRPSGQVSAPFGAFGTQQHHGRISLLPQANVPIRLLHLTMEGDEGMRKSRPFSVEDISISDGGVEATPLAWEDGSPSGYYAYRNLVKAHQSEVHIVPEYIVFNGSKSHNVRVQQPGGFEMVIGPGKIAPLRTHSQETAAISVEFIELRGRTPPLRVDSLGLRVAVIKSPDGQAIGSLALQTVVGARDSRLVVKLGDIKFGSLKSPDEVEPEGLFANDFLRVRMQWSELRITLDEGRPIVAKNQAFFESALDRIREATSPSKAGIAEAPDSRGTWMEAREVQRSSDELGGSAGDPVCTVLLHRFTVDWQRVFKDEATDQQTAREALRSPERSQLSVIIHNVQLRDETPNSPYPVVFDSTSDVSFFDLCIRCKGPLNTELVEVDLFDLNLAHANGVSQQIIVQTSEDFVWKLLDLANRILIAAGEFAGMDIELKWDEDHGGYAVAIKDKKIAFIEEESSYSPPKSDTIYDVTRARVSPFTMLVSFKRTPQSARYKLMKGKGAHLMNYFTRRLKFKIEKAELKFSRYEASNIKGPPDRLIELLSTVYLSRMKLKMVTILTAASFQDWKALASRDGGDDEFVDGDILRVTGNIAGNTAAYVLRNAGRGIGQGVSNATRTLGEGIESASDAIGARAVGAGVNSLVSGIGEGASSTISGVGSGAGRMIKGVGLGAGQVFGGVTGGAMMIGKGIGTGITTGDGRALVSGVTEGVSSVGTGVGQGVESVVTGTAEGFLSVGQGLFSGVKSVGRGIGGAFSECCSCDCFGCCTGEEESSHENALTSPLLPHGSGNMNPP